MSDELKKEVEDEAAEKLSDEELDEVSGGLFQEYGVQELDRPPGVF